MVWKPRGNQNSEGGVGFLVRECLVDEVEYISDVHYEESVWMKVKRKFHCTNSASIEGCYEKMCLA